MNLSSDDFTDDPLHRCMYDPDEPDGLDVHWFQRQVHAWEVANFGKQEPWLPLLGVGEEAGELMHAVLKLHQGIRGSEEKHRAEMVDAVGDLVVFLAAFCSLVDINLEDTILNTWREVKKRDWRKDPLHGGINGGTLDGE